MTTFLDDDNQRSDEDSSAVIVRGSEIIQRSEILETSEHGLNSRTNYESDYESDYNNNVLYDLAMLEISPIVIIRWTLPEVARARFTYVSSNMHQLGYSAEALISENINWFDLVHPEDLPKMKQTIRAAVDKQEENYIQNYRIKQPSGDYRWIENRGNIVRTEDGRIRYFQGLLTDISERKAVEVELSQKTAYLEILHETTLGLVQRLDLHNLFDSLVKRLAILVDADFASLNIVDTVEDQLEMVALSGLDKSALNSKVSMGEGLLGTVWQSKQPTYIENYQVWEKRLDNATFDNVKSVAALPLMCCNKVIGVMGFGTKNIIQFDDNKQTLLQSFAQIASVAIENAQVFQNAQIELEERQRLELNLESERNALAKQILFRTELASLVKDSLSGKFAEDFYQAILERAIAIVPGADAGSLLVKGYSEKFSFKAAVGYDVDILKDIKLSEAEIYRDIRSNKPMRIYEEDVELVSNQQFKVALTIPIHLYGEPIALFSLDNFHNRNAFSDDTLYLAKIFGNQVTALWQRFQLEQNLRSNQDNYRQLFLEASRYSKELQILDKLRSAIASKLELDELLDTACKSIVDVFGYGRVCIGMIRGSHVVKVATHGTDETMSLPDKSPITNKTFQAINETGKAYFVTQNSTIFKQDADKKTMIVLPLKSQDEIKGYIAVGCKSRNISNNEQALIEKIIDQLDIAIDNATLHSQVKKDLARTEALYKLSQAMQENSSFAGFMDSTIEHIRAALGARWAVMYKMDFSYGTVKHFSTAQLDSKPLDPFSFEELNSGLAGWAIRHQKIAISPNVAEETREHPSIVQKNIDLNVSSTIEIPLTYQNEVFGTLGVLNQISDAEFTTEDINLLTAIANQTSVALAQYELREEVEHQAFHDSLTGLSNRIFIENSLKAALKKSSEDSSCFATMFLDLDGFKNVNDTLGHDVGDELLKAVAGRLTSNTSSIDTLARMGGDEFAVIINNLLPNETGKAIAVAQRYLKVLQEPFQIGKHTIKIGVSIGISFYPIDGKDITSLLKHADSAMYQAKYSGKNNVCVFTPELAEKVKDRIDMENDLRRVIKEGGLELYYQPQVCLKTNRCIGVEALLRWNHPTKGYISPDDFIPVSEESKLILDIGKWVIQESCRQNVAWQAEGYQPITVAINVSALQFESPDFVETVTKALEESGLDPQYLEMELTESVVMQDVNAVVERLYALRNLGIKVSIDDFGTGYSSLQYLQKLPIDKLKIDRSFVNEISSQNNSAIITSIFFMAQSLGLKTVAEGVETQEQLDFLILASCDEAQGYYYSRAVKASEVWEIIHSQEHILTESAEATQYLAS